MTLDTVPLHRLVHSRANARRTGRKAPLHDLLASIRNHGLRQNLNVRPITGGRFEVVAGGRRLRALKQLARAGSLPPDHPVPCLLLADADDPLEVSVAENVVREPMHPDDQCAAFQTLVEAGSSIDEVAARFGLTPAVVRQRLKLASVSPALRARFRRGELTLDQVQAFALVDDHAQQEAVWAELPDWNRGPEAIRRALTRSAIPLTHRLAQFVGLEVYQAYGGPVIRDLFGDPDACFLADGHLLERLATDRLTRLADEVRREGWSWVSIEPDLDWSARYDRVYPDTREDGSIVFSTEDLARAGARLSLDQDGSVRIDRGLVHPDAVKATRRHKAEEKSTGAPGLSAKLVEELTAHRTAALRLELAHRPELALAATVHALTLSPIYAQTYGSPSCLALKAESAPLESHVQNSPDGLAHPELADLDATWRARLPDDPSDLWTWCISQPQPILLDLLAFIAGLSINAVETRCERAGSPRLQHATQLAGALNLDLASWWRPSTDGFGQRVSKAALAGALAEIGQDGLALRVRGAKKREAARLAIPALVEARWLPAPLRPDRANPEQNRAD